MNQCIFLAHEVYKNTQPYLYLYVYFCILYYVYRISCCPHADQIQ